MITELPEGGVFVFGSHVSGHHAGGAARYAVDHFGAVVGQGEGLQGDSYAIPTMGDAGELQSGVARFLQFAKDHPELEFFLTPIGTGIAGWPVAVVAAMFSDAPLNVVLPDEFVAVL